ncbi:cytochrome P450 [Nocardioides speluncae]|uniref:cytochrome P450 n=1 Tax=Nocardioides speluncae TaxID=2670337 RepID=UPI00197F663E|nr:cytochrome P450 [Nocardioides speluncae]
MMTMRTRTVRRIGRLAARATVRFPAPTKPLAAPPPGSGLKPVLGSFGPPVLGTSLAALHDMLAFSRRQLEEYGEVSWAGGPSGKMALAIGPEAAEQMLIDRDRAFSAKRGWSFIIGPFFHGGVMLMDLEEHHHHRRILQAAFTRQRLEGYLDLTTPEIKRALDGWQPAPDFALYSETKKLLLELATEVFVGTEVGPEAAELERAFVNAVRGGQAIVRAPVPGLTWSRGLRGRRFLEEYFLRELPAKRAGDGDDLFSVLCRAESEDGQRFTDDEVVAHMIFVMMAAHDTSTIALSMMAYLLAKHPEWQEWLRAESQALGKTELAYADLDRLPSMDLVFREAMRLYAPVGMQLRETVKDTELCGYYLPTGTRVWFGDFVTMRSDRWWPDADRFDPERFAEGRREDKSHRFAWAPFGGGAHKCIGLYFGGMTVKAVMHQLLLRFRWSVPDGYDVPLTWGTGPTPADGLPIRLERLSG